MCGIVGLHLREPSLYPRLGELLTGMLGQVCERLAIERAVTSHRLELGTRENDRTTTQVEPRKPGIDGADACVGRVGHGGDAAARWCDVATVACRDRGHRRTRSV